jgi:hypothetical protein
VNVGRPSRAEAAAARRLTKGDDREVASRDEGFSALAVDTSGNIEGPSALDVAPGGVEFVELPLTYGVSEGAVSVQNVVIARHAHAWRYAGDATACAAQFERAVDLASQVVKRELGLDALEEEDLDLVRQTSLVNLYFFLRYVAAYSCAFTKLKPTLHGEMCNTVQRALIPGIRLQVTVPRATFKSTIATVGLGAWKLWRDPNRRIGIFSGIQERAVDFLHQIQRIYDSNDFVTLLRPDTKPRSRRDGTWNEKVAIMQNRTMQYVEPSVRAHAAGGSTAGIHVDDALIDDIVSDKELTSTRDVTSEMIKRRDWLQTAIATILDSPSESCVVLSDTRYALDDPYEAPTRNSREHLGDWSAIEDHYAVAEDGEWVTYYRSALVGDISIFPEKYTKAWLEQLSKNDFWTYITQYVNNPHSVDKVEFSQYNVGYAKLGVDFDGRIVVCVDGKDYALRSADVVLAVDPASSGTRRNVRTSRSAVVALARFARRRYVILDVRAGYWRPAELFDQIFAMHARFRDYARATFVEAAGNFKFLIDMLREEEMRRRTYVNTVGVTPLGDKLATIRSALEPLLREATLFVVDDVRETWMAEFRVFPSMSLDILDATKIGISQSSPPDDDFEDEEDDFDDDDREEENAFGRRRAFV